MRGQSQPLLALTAIGAAVLLPGCSSSSHGSAAAPSPSSTTPAPPASPAINVEQQAVGSLAGAAAVTLSTSSRRIALHTSGDEPVQLGIDPHGNGSVEATWRDSADDVFALAGPAPTGATTADRVSVLAPALGLIVDTTQGNFCTVTYSRVTETALAGTARCDAESGAQRITVTVAFTAR